MRQITAQVIQEALQLAPVMYACRYFGVANEHQAAAIMLKGYEIGLPLIASFDFVKPIETKRGNSLSLSPQGALALVRASGLLASISVTEERDATGKPSSCTVTMSRVDGDTRSWTSTMDDAKRSGVVKPDSGWEKYPANMMQWRSTGFVIDWLFSDVTCGLKTADQWGADLALDGSISSIESQVSLPQASMPHMSRLPEPREDPVMLALQELSAHVDPAVLMELNGGAIPSTLDEIEQVRIKIEMMQLQKETQ